MDAAILRYRWTAISAAQGLPAIVQEATNQWPGQNALGDPQSLTETLSLPGSITAGNFIVVLAANYNLGGTGGTVSMADNLGNTYTKRIQVDDDDPSANMSLYVFTCPITSGGSHTLTGTWNQPEWQALHIVELSGIASSSQYITSASNVQTAGGTTTDSLNSGALACGSVAGMVLAWCLNGTDQNLANGGGVGSPSVGTGLTGINSGIINWNGEENSFVGPACQPQYKTSSSLGTVTPTWTPKKAGESYVSVGIALKGA
jgi:hypothetical protein